MLLALLALAGQILLGAAMPAHGLQGPLSAEAVICHTGNDFPGQPKQAPGQPADCALCTLCSTLAQLPLLPAGGGPAIPPRTAATVAIAVPLLSEAPLAALFRHAVQPRAPPFLV